MMNKKQNPEFRIQESEW